MIASLEGKVSFQNSDSIILDVEGVGYRVFLSEQTLKKITGKEETLKVFVSLLLKRETLELYGFLSPEELDFFEIMNEISGIGPKAALAITSLGSLEDLKRAIEKGDQGFFKGVRGIGRKKIQKIILELSGKIKTLKSPSAIELDEKDKKVLQALISLGFSHFDSKQVISQIPENLDSVVKRIKEALRILKGVK